MLAVTFRLALRTWLRYLVPLTLIAAVTMCLVAYVAHATPVPKDTLHARSELHLGWLLAATAWMFQLVLVGAAAPAVRGIALDAPLSQRAALAEGLRGLGRAVVPCGVAVAAIVLGGTALVVPGLVLLALLALTGASNRLGEPLPAALADSVAVVRAHARQVVVIVALVIVADLAVALVAHLAILPYLPAKPPLVVLARARTFVRITALALITLSALPACALAAIYGTATRRA